MDIKNGKKYTETMTGEEEISLTKEWTRKVVNVMQAYIDGKEIEERCGLGNWHDCPLPIWDWIANDYRIKGKNNIMEIGDRVTFRCFDGSTIDVTVVEFEDGNVIGVSETGSRHWCPMRDVIV